jgi:hypothetical protein
MLVFGGLRCAYPPSGYFSPFGKGRLRGIYSVSALDNSYLVFVWLLDFGYWIF